MAKLTLSTPAINVVNDFLMSKYPLTTLLYSLGDVEKGILTGEDLTTYEEGLLLCYLGGDAEVTVAEKPWSYILDSGSKITLPNGKVVTLAHSVTLQVKA